MDEKPLRPRFRFSLRTLLLATAAVAIWFGWEVNVSRERHRVRAWVESHGGIFHHHDRYRCNFMDDWKEAQVVFTGDITDEEFAKVQIAFPEAKVVQWKWPDKKATH